MSEQPEVPDYFPGPVPCYAPGDLVIHARYAYRGVVVDFDLTCRANEAWYRRNRTQPKRDQPWYHVLVDGSTLVTYAAETSLYACAAKKPVNHPLVSQLFDAFREGRYERNDTPWPGWDGVERDDGEDEA